MTQTINVELYTTGCKGIHVPLPQEDWVNFDFMRVNDETICDIFGLYYGEDFKVQESVTRFFYDKPKSQIGRQESLIKALAESPLSLRDVNTVVEAFLIEESSRGVVGTKVPEKTKNLSTEKFATYLLDGLVPGIVEFAPGDHLNLDITALENGRFLVTTKGELV